MTGEGAALSGSWGGKLYGNGASTTDYPSSITGTFGAKADDDLFSILSAFGAHKQ